MRINPVVSGITVIFLTLCPAIHTRADIYRCTDEAGNTTYRTAPCPAGSASEVIKNGRHSESGTQENNPGTYDYERQEYRNGDFKKVELITKGSLVDVVDYVVPGKYTIFVFYADWCGPCKPAKEKLARLAESVDTLAVRKLDIISWDYPLAKYYNIESIPYFIVYGPDGKFIESGNRLSKSLLSDIAAGN